MKKKSTLCFILTSSKNKTQVGRHGLHNLVAMAKNFKSKSKCTLRKNEPLLKAQGLKWRVLFVVQSISGLM